MMCKRFKNSTPLFLVILKLCVKTSDTATVQDLSLICGISDGKAEFSKIPPQCTAVGEYTSNMGGMHAAYGKKGSLPFMIIVNNVDYNNKPGIKTMLGNLKADIKYDFIAFDLTEVLSVNPIRIPVNAVTQYLVDFFKGVKPDGDEALLGYFIHNDLQLLKDKHIDFTPINRVSEFYIINTTCIKDCRYYEFLKDIPVQPQPDIDKDIATAISGLSGMGLALNQLIFTMDLKMESILVIDPDNYNYVCFNKEPPDFRRYCANPLQCLFKHAGLRRDKNMLGIFVNSIEYDDVTGKCGCKTGSNPNPAFPSLKTIEEASKGGQRFTGCIK